MAGYMAFANYYDQLTDNVSYHQRAAYFHNILKEYVKSPALVVDLACGTGSLSIELSNLGYEVIGVDASADMLSVAMNKCSQVQKQLLFLNQPMEELDLYGTVDAVVCALDSINHITDPDVLLRAFKQVSLFLNPGGIFVFDCNTVYKHQKTLADHCFVYETEDVFCVWQNALLPEDMVEVTLDFFLPQSKHYIRQTECFCERAYETDVLQEMLLKAGLNVVAVYEADTFDPPKPQSDRLVFVAQK